MHAFFIFVFCISPCPIARRTEERKGKTIIIAPPSLPRPCCSKDSSFFFSFLVRVSQLSGFVGSLKLPLLVRKNVYFCLFWISMTCPRALMLEAQKTAYLNRRSVYMHSKLFPNKWRTSSAYYFSSNTPEQQRQRLPFIDRGRTTRKMEEALELETKKTRMGRDVPLVVWNMNKICTDSVWIPCSKGCIYT